MERFVEVPGARLYARCEGQGQGEGEGQGEGDPVVLIHSAIVDQRSWDGVVPGLVAAGYRVVRYDLRGFGRSQTQDVEYDERDDLRRVMDAFDVRRAALVGNSRGGFIAIDVAIETPDRVVAIVTLGSEPGGFEGTTTPTEDALIAEGERLESAPQRDPDALTDLDVRFWVDGPGHSPARVPARVRDAVREWARPLYLPGHVSGRRIRLNPAANERLGELRCPVLAVAGALDLAMMVQAARRLEAAAPNARAVIWPDVAHMVALEQPDRVVGLVRDFLAPLRPWQ